MKHTVKINIDRCCNKKNLEYLLKDFKKLTLSTENYGHVDFQIEIYKREDNVELIFQTDFDDVQEAERYRERYLDNQKGISKKVLKQMSYNCFIHEIQEYLNNFTVICNICKPGCISFSSPAIAISGAKTINFNSLRNNFDWHYEEENEFFPSLYEIKIQDAMCYFSKLPGFWGGFSSTNVGIAMHCFTHMFSDDYHWIFPNDFLWAMIGLEALYGQGNQAMMNQIIKKSETFLGLDKKGEKAIKEMYDFRSRVFHGQVHITNPIMFNHHLNTKRSKYSDREFEATVNTVHLLILSLQKCIKENIYDLNFKYTLDPA